MPLPHMAWLFQTMLSPGITWRLFVDVVRPFIPGGMLMLMAGLLCSSFHLTPSLWSEVFGSILARARSWREDDLFTLFANLPRPELREFCDARRFNVPDAGSMDDSLGGNTTSSRYFEWPRQPPEFQSSLSLGGICAVRGYWDPGGYSVPGGYWVLVGYCMFVGLITGYWLLGGYWGLLCGYWGLLVVYGGYGPGGYLF